MTLGQVRRSPRRKGGQPPRAGETAAGLQGRREEGTWGDVERGPDDRAGEGLGGVEALRYAKVSELGNSALADEHVVGFYVCREG